MTDALRLAIHDPALLTPAARDAQLLAHRGLCDELAADLRATPADRVPQHRLLLGAGGTGKSMLLACVGDAVGLPIARCHVADGLASPAMLWRLVAARAFDATLDGERSLPELLELARDHEAGRVLILIDGLDAILETFDERETWALREALAAHPELALVATATRLPPAAYDYEGAFFDFFGTHTLQALSAEAARALLPALAAAIGADAVHAALEADAARVDALCRLAFGVPRALALTLEALLVHGTDAAPEVCMRHVADRLTPRYEERLRSVSPLARVVLAALARHWHPAHAKTLGADLGMPTNKVSTYLDRLTRDGLVDKVPMPPGKTSGFQVHDRAFGAWFALAGDRDARGADRLTTLARALASGVGETREELRRTLAPDADLPDARLAPELREVLADD